MLLHIARANEDEYSARRCAELAATHAFSRSGLHTLTADAEAAELILLGGDFESIEQARANALLKRYPEKTMIYSESDTGIPYVPGVYGSAAKKELLGLKRTRSFVYLSRFHSSLNPEIRHRPGERKDLLFCLRAKRDCRVRARIFDHDYGRADVVVVDTTSYRHWDASAMDRETAQKEYADTLARSHFALCPRGAGFGSIRLFEVMEMGVAPVLLADRYALPQGPDWDSFLIQVEEKNYARLPELLEPHVGESEARGELARVAWDKYFAREVAFDRLVEQLVAIRAARTMPERLYRALWPLEMLRRDGRAKVGRVVRRGLRMARQLSGNTAPPKGQVPSDLE